MLSSPDQAVLGFLLHVAGGKLPELRRLASSTPSRAHDGAATGVCQLFLDAMSGKFDDPTDAWLRPEKRS